ncbi:MAG: phosphoribosylformylglycinamidine synthase subunit PurL [Nitrososphaerota archaeon]
MTPQKLTVGTSLSEKDLQELKARLGRDPTPVEVAIAEALWSEHCSYRTTRGLLRSLPTEGRRVVLGPGYDAGVIEVGDGYVVSVHIESHNHPSAIDPYGGAATGVGGVVRDILTVGTRPIALLNSIRFGPVEVSAHSRWLLSNVVRGISDYGNSIGVPTVAGEVEFDPCFERNCLVDVACIGLGRIERLLVPRADRPGSLLLLIGNHTGRDGIRGAAFASRPLSGSEDDRYAVQVPDPFTEKLLIDAITELVDGGLVLAVKDLGAGGLATAVPEILHKGGTGGVLDLSAVHLREPDMTPIEVLLSESQERMLLVVERELIGEVLRVLERYEVPSSLIGEVTEGGRLRVLWRGEVLADAPVWALVDAPEAPPRGRGIGGEDDQKGAKVTAELTEPEDLEEVLLRMLASPNLCSKEWVYSQYDQEVGTRTVLRPGEGDAAVLALPNGKFLAVKLDGDPKKCALDPYLGAMNVVSECRRNLTCVGAETVAIVDHLQFGDPGDPEVYASLEMTVRAIADYCRATGIPVVGGKVSLYNSDSVTGRNIKPTPVIGGIGIVERPSMVTRVSFRRKGDPIVLVGSTCPELGGSEYAELIHGSAGGPVPPVDPDEDSRICSAVLHLISLGAVLAAHDSSRGGLGVALAEMSIGGGIGASIDLRRLRSDGPLRDDVALFSEGRSRIILEVREEDLRLCGRVLDRQGLPWSVIGRTGGRSLTVTRGRKELVDLSIGELRRAWSSLERLMGGWA